ncbi:MAG: PIN domain-containing protein [Chloroflexota bacterium]|nr:PIN domain-containing protein [Chloroflexota bacterium]
MRAVLDANVLAPGFLGATSTSARLIDLWRRRVYDLVVSEHLLAELARTYTDAYFRRRITLERSRRVDRFLRRRALLTELTVTVQGVATQPKDDLVLSTGLSAGATYLATRDRQLLKLGAYEGLHIVPPGQLLALLEQEKQREP